MVSWSGLYRPCERLRTFPTELFVGARLYVHLVKISALHRVAGPLGWPGSEVYKGHGGGFPRAVPSVDSRIAKQRTTEGKWDPQSRNITLTLP